MSALGQWNHVAEELKAGCDSYEINMWTKVSCQLKKLRNIVKWPNQWLMSSPISSMEKKLIIGHRETQTSEKLKKIINNIYSVITHAKPYV